MFKDISFQLSQKEKKSFQLSQKEKKSFQLDIDSKVQS